MTILEDQITFLPIAPFKIETSDIYYEDDMYVKYTYDDKSLDIENCGTCNVLTSLVKIMISMFVDKSLRAYSYFGGHGKYRYVFEPNDNRYAIHIFRYFEGKFHIMIWEDYRTQLYEEMMEYDFNKEQLLESYFEDEMPKLTRKPIFALEGDPKLFAQILVDATLVTHEKLNQGLSKEDHVFDYNEDEIAILKTWLSV